jgi:hypothetical protein
MRRAWATKFWSLFVISALVLGGGWLVLFLDTFIPYITLTEEVAKKVADAELQRRIRLSRLEAGNYSKPIIVSLTLEGKGGNRKAYKFIAIPSQDGFPIIFIGGFNTPNDRDVQSTYSNYVLHGDDANKRLLIERAIAIWSDERNSNKAGVIWGHPLADRSQARTASPPAVF